MSKSKNVYLATVEYALASDEPEAPAGPFNADDLRRINAVGKKAQEFGNVGKGKFAFMRSKPLTARKDKQCVILVAFGKAARRLDKIVRKECPHLSGFKAIP
jgi:hypothetical protein